MKAIFSNKVADYAASRPDYPAALFALLQQRCPPAEAVTVADVGAGTGLLTRGLLASGYRVAAVEPNREMRAAADRQFAGAAGYRGVDGGAEAMPLETASVDLIATAQAFHWFDQPPTRAEFQRVLRPGGLVALIWNDRILSDPLHAALDHIFERYGGERRSTLVTHENRRNVPAFFAPGVPEQFTWPNSHQLDEAGLRSLVFSRSYMPPRNTPAAHQAEEALQEVFQRFATAGQVEVRYETVLFLGTLVV